MINRVLIIGIGLIGGSLALALKRSRPELHISGYDRENVLASALATGVIDESVHEIPEAAGNSELVIIAVPVGRIPDSVSAVAPHVRHGTIITDVGSVKKPILERAASVLPAGVHFIGGHPMAGSEYTGLSSADPFLFENTTYVLCPPTDASDSDFRSTYGDFFTLIRETGAHPLILDAERHDSIAAAISHLPQILAVTLVNETVARNRQDDAFLQLAAGGFRDITRIASSSYPIWHDILRANREQTSAAIERFERALAGMREKLAEDNLTAIREAFDEARDARSTIPKDTKGFLHPLSDVYVYAEDQPGFLARLTRTLYEARLNIRDIELLKIREGTGGAFRIGFSTDIDANAAVDALRAAGYTANRL